MFNLENKIDNKGFALSENVKSLDFSRYYDIRKEFNSALADLSQNIAENNNLTKEYQAMVDKYLATFSAILD